MVTLNNSLMLIIRTLILEMMRTDKTNKKGGQRQNDGKIRCRRGFKQLYNGNIYKQQNIEKYSGQTFNGDVFSQANIDNSCQFSKRSASELDINKRWLK